MKNDRVEGLCGVCRELVVCDYNPILPIKSEIWTVIGRCPKCSSSVWTNKVTKQRPKTDKKESTRTRTEDKLNKLLMAPLKSNLDAQALDRGMFNYDPATRTWIAPDDVKYPAIQKTTFKLYTVQNGIRLKRIG